MHMKLRPVAVLVLSALLVTACSSDKKDKEEVNDNRPVEALYNEAAAKMDAGAYRDAAAAFDKVDRQYPYSEWATRAQLMAGYTYYKDMDYDSAIVALDRFIQLHPGNKDIDYAYYLKALSYYEQITDVGRDQEMTQQAMDALDAILERFPNSRYARDAQLKKDLTRDHLAGKEMTVGRYYQKQDIPSAALRRYQNVVKNYQTTTHTPEALYRIVEVNYSLGLDAESARVAAILGYNFPGSRWYKDAYALLKPEYRTQLDQEQAKNKGFIKRTLDSVF